jgi:hypothetical protein
LNRDANAVRHEQGLALFILPRRRPRFRYELSERTLNFHDFRDLDPRFAEPLPSKLAWPKILGPLLRERGAPEQCYVVSSYLELYCREMPLDEALAQILGGFEIGAFLSCLPGKLAYFQDEECKRYILHHP